MLRCVLLSAVLAVSVAAHAQVARPFPADALRGEMQVLTAPDLLLNGQAARLAPGARIHGDNNLLRLPGELVGSKWLVHYTQERDGLVNQVWVLNPAERANKIWPSTREEAAKWRFDAAQQRWIKP